LGRIPYPIVSDPQMPTYLNLKIKKYEQKFRNFIKEILDERIKGSNDPGDLLSLIIKLYGKENEKGEIEIDEEAVVREIYLAIFAGYETSSATITWVFHLLAENKDKYEKLQREIDSSMKMDSISTEKIMELKYVDHVLSEVLRIKTAPWITGRTAKKDVEISGQHVKKDSMVVLCPHFAHHDSNYWDDPKKFVPERWEDTNQNNINKNSYMPFGAGPRKCIGMDFSKAEMKVIMVLMLMNFEFDIDPDFTVKTAYGMTAYPENGLKMLVKRRNQD
ncbi:MAG: cytochrome P450, partial [Bacteroidota bacterium]